MLLLWGGAPLKCPFASQVSGVRCLEGTSVRRDHGPCCCSGTGACSCPRGRDVPRDARDLEELQVGERPDGPLAETRFPGPELVTPAASAAARRERL